MYLSYEFMKSQSVGRMVEALQRQIIVYMKNVAVNTFVHPTYNIAQLELSEKYGAILQ